MVTNEGKFIKVFLFILTFGVLLLNSSISHAANFYLNPGSGNDSANGTMSAPWKTLSKAITSVNAGDTIYIRGGKYTKKQFYYTGVFSLRWEADDRRGKAGSPITVQPAPGEDVVIDGLKETYFVSLIGAAGYSGHYVIFRKLQFENFDGIAIGVNDAKNVAVDVCGTKYGGRSWIEIFHGLQDKLLAYHIKARGQI